MVAVNALYVAAEFATVGSRRSRVQELADAGNRGAAGLLEILRTPASWTIMWRPARLALPSAACWQVLLVSLN
ncbi:CNNM domain-containing protein [Deinococcus radiophilus]|uniref:CNNM domain-containing protein n=1 Tax=Deinococcus radiophilus TaxID=32062 RepID=UPI003610F179